MVRKRPNARFLLISLGLVLVLGVSIHFVHGFQVQRNSSQLKERAEAAESEGDYVKAVQLLAQYRSFQEDDYDALLHLVRLKDGLAIHPKSLEGVLYGYEEVLRRDPGRPDEFEIRQDVIAVAGALGDYSLALYHLDTLLNEDKFATLLKAHPEQKARLLFQRGQCHEGEGRIDAALTDYLAALDEEETNYRHYLPLARLFLDQTESLPRIEKKNEPDTPTGPQLLSKQIQALYPPEDATIPKTEGQIPRRKETFDASKHAGQILEWMVEFSNSKPAAYLARAQFRYLRGQFDSARSDVDDAQKLAPEDAAIALFSGQMAVDQAQAGRLTGKIENYFDLIALAQKTAEWGQAQTPPDARFYLLGAPIFEESRQGLRLFPAIAQKSDDPLPDRTFSSDFLEAQWRLYKAAETDLKKGIATWKETVKAQKARFPERLAVLSQNPKPALNYRQLVLLGNQLQWSLADTLISQDELLKHGHPLRKDTDSDRRAKVEELLTALERAGEATGLREFLRARLMVADENWTEAAWTLEQTRLRLTGRSELKNRIDLLLDQCYARLGNPDQELRVALRALGENPNWSPALIKLPELYRQANQVPEAIKAYERIKIVPGALLSIAQLRLQQELAKPLESRDWTKIQEALDAEQSSGFAHPGRLSILKAEVAALEAAQLEDQGQAADAHDKYREALSLLDDAILTWPRDAEVWAARALLELKLPIPAARTTRERISAAEAILNKAVEEVGGRVELQLAAMQTIVLLPPAEALRELGELEEHELPLADQPRFLDGLVQAYAQLGLKTEEEKERDASLKRATAIRKRAAELQSSEIEPQISLAEFASGQKDFSAMDQAIARVEKVEGPAGPNGNYLKALRLLAEIKDAKNLSSEDQERIAKVRRLLQAARRERPFWPVLSRTLGQMEEAVGNLEGAVTYYEKAFELGDRSRRMITMMVDYYRSHQRIEYADNFLRKVAQDAPILLSGELARQQWQVAWSMHRFDEAIGVASRLASQSSDFRDHLWEARMRLSRNESGPEVLKALKAACNKAPAVEPIPWLELVSYYVRTGERPAAEAALEEARSKIAKEPPYLLPLAVARCYEYLNDREKAEEQYLKALQATKEKTSERTTQQIILADFYSRTPGANPEEQALDVKKANEVLDQLLDRSANVPDYARAWARRRKALIAAFSGRYDDTQRALELLAGDQAEGEDLIEKLHTEARILNVRGRYPDRIALIQVLETLSQKNALSAEEKLLLARTYESTNQWTEAAARFRELLEEVGKENKIARGSLLAEFSIALLNSKEGEIQERLAEGEKVVQELEALEPKSFRSVTTRALLDFRQGKGAEAVPRLKGYLKSLDVITPDAAFRDLVQQNQLEEALMFLQKQLDDTNAKQIVEHVRKLKSEGKEEQALVTLKSYIQASDLVDGVQTTLVRVIARFLEELEQYPAAEEVFHQFVARSKQPESPLELAAFLARRGRIDEALDLCESAWKTCDPRLVAKVSVGSLRSKKPTTANIQRVEGPLEDALENATDENRLELITTYADLRDLQGRHEDSINLYRELLRQDPQHAVALNNLAWLLSYRPEFQSEALKLIEKAIVLYGPQGALLDTRGMVHLRRGSAQTALLDLLKAVDELPSAALYFHLAQIQLALGNHSAAEQAFREAQKYNLDFVNDLHVLEASDYQKVSKLLE